MGWENKQVLIAASVASMIDQFNMQNICLMQQLGYEVHVACNFRKGNTCDGERIKKLRKNLRRMHVIQHQWDCPRDVGAVPECMRAYRQILALVDRCHFAWIHCHSPIGGVLARMAAHMRNVRVIYTAHGFHFYKGAPVKNWLLYYPVEKLFAHWTDVLVTVNQEDYSLAKRKLRADSIYRIPGVGIDVEKYMGQAVVRRLEQPADRNLEQAYGKEAPVGRNLEQAYGKEAPVGRNLEQAYGKEALCEWHEIAKEALCERYGIPGKARILLSVGELNEGKNHRLVIEAMAALPREDVYYLICGQGTLREELQRFADKSGVGRRIRMPGYQDEMPFIYQGADVFVFPSEREGMPTALMEAMAAGLPCAVSDIRGNRELIDDRFRFPPGQAKRLAALLSVLLSDRQLRQMQGSRNREKAKNYSQAAVRKRMLDIYLQMEAGGNKESRKQGKYSGKQGKESREQGKESREQGKESRK